MPDDKTDPREADEDQAKVADSSKAEAPRLQIPTPMPVSAAISTRCSPKTPRCATGCCAPWPTWRICAAAPSGRRSDTARYAISNFARDVLTVGDNLKRTIDHVPAEAAAGDPALKSFLEGVELTERELLNVLERHGVTRIEPLGQRFDPNCHQAMYEVENADVPEGTVVDVMQSGYTIGDRCLRPALVAVSKGGAKVGQAKERRQRRQPAPGRQRRFPRRRSRARLSVLTSAWSPAAA